VTPLVLQATGGTAGTNPQDTILLVNRGWVPMQRVLQQNGRPQRRSPQQQQRQPSSKNNHGGGNSAETPPSALLQWDRPTGDVQVTVVPGKPEGSYMTVMDCLVGCLLLAYLLSFLA